MTTPYRIAGLSLLALSCGAAWAQSPALDAGSLRQQIEPRALPALPAAQPQAPEAPRALVQPASGATVTVQHFRFSGNTLLDEAQLQAAVASFVNRPLSFADLSLAAEAVTAAYRRAGWLARAVLPAQTIEAGVVTVQVVESRFAGVRTEGESAKLVMPAEVQAHISRQLQADQPLNLHALDRALLLADDLPGVSVAGTLAAGPGEGQTTLLLQTADEPRLYGDASLDNLGARATGSVRQMLNLNLNSPGGRGELLSVNLLHSRGLDYGRIALTVPDGHNGRRLGVYASALKYEVVTGPAAGTAAAIRGRSNSLGLEWNHPLLRQRLANLYFSGGLETEHFYNEDTELRSDYHTDSLRLGLSGNRFDSMGGGGANSASMQMLWGRLGDIVKHTQQNRLEGGFRKINYSASRQQAITPGHSLLLSLQGQHATRALDSSEKFYIGGVGSVRAYPASELGGERGQVLTAEWRWRLSPAWVLAAFLDQGRVVSLPARSGDIGSTLSLRGRGLSLAWQGQAGVATRLTWSHRNGSHPQPTADGTDSDGTRKLNRVWLSTTLAF